MEKEGKWGNQNGIFARAVSIGGPTISEALQVVAALTGTANQRTLGNYIFLITFVRVGSISGLGARTLCAAVMVTYRFGKRWVAQ